MIPVRSGVFDFLKLDEPTTMVLPTKVHATIEKTLNARKRKTDTWGNCRRGLDGNKGKLQLTDMADDIDQKLDALGDATRRGVLRLLRNGPRSVSDLAEHFPVSRPAISQHLRILSDAGFVEATPQGTRRLYTVRPDAFVSLRTYIDDFWTAALNNFKHRAESKARRRRSA